ncbi:MAG: hypothetical protein ACPIOQ_51980, partial [Promethearchaeia archaeon]
SGGRCGENVRREPVQCEMTSVVPLTISQLAQTQRNGLDLHAHGSEESLRARRSILAPTWLARPVITRSYMY